MTTVKFNKHHVASAGQKARCHYSVDNRYGGGRCVTIYAKDFESGRVLGGIFPEQYVNRTDTQSDYFDMGHVELMEGHPHYAAARIRAESWAAPKVERDTAETQADAYLATLPPSPEVAATAVSDAGGSDEDIEHAYYRTLALDTRAFVPWRHWCAVHASPGVPSPMGVI